MFYEIYSHKHEGELLCINVYVIILTNFPLYFPPRFTTKHVSPHLQNTELASIREAPPIHGNMEVRAYSSVSEVSVVYRVDEFSIELFLRLPESYPLQPPVLREGKRVRVDQAHWRKWLLQLNIFVTNQVHVRTYKVHVLVLFVHSL